ncbi:hypothetical protein [Streptomyces sp. ID05-04B]|uniref:hypothetical protein n=1 Tax=Streptomyces sp. ID05-04B TaxID=3028661 RepID=UPI0039F6EBB5
MTDLAGDRADGVLPVAQSVGGEGEAPAGDSGHGSQRGPEHDGRGDRGVRSYRRLGGMRRRAVRLDVRSTSRAQGFDWCDASTWADVLRGADAAYLLYPTDVGDPGGHVRAVGRLAREAVVLGGRGGWCCCRRGGGAGTADRGDAADVGRGLDRRAAAWFARDFRRVL